MSSKTRVIIVVLCLLGSLWLRRGQVLTSIYGYPYGIETVDRTAHDIPEINWGWDRYPTDKPKSATQIWINDDEHDPHYAKQIGVDKDFLGVSYEEDRYKIRDLYDAQLDLVMRWEPDGDGIEQQAWIEKVEKIDLAKDPYDWFEVVGFTQKLTLAEAAEMLDSIHSGNMDSIEDGAKTTLSAEQLQEVKLVARYEVVDGTIERNLHYCQSEIRPFLKMDTLDCSFRINWVEYNLREKYVFDQEGYVSAYWDYKSEGPLIYKRKDLEADVKFARFVGISDVPIKVLGDKVIFGSDTTMVDFVLERHQLIFMTYQEREGRMTLRTIYEYE